MSGISSCKNFLRGLDIIELKSIRVEIVRPKIVGPAIVENIERNLGDPKTLVIHFKKKESFRGIFDREDIVVNKEIPGEGISRSRNDNRRSTSNENRKSSLITAVSSSGPKGLVEANSRHRSLSLEKPRRRSRSPQKRSRTPQRRSRSPRDRRNRSRSRSRSNADYRPRRIRSPRDRRNRSRSRSRNNADYKPQRSRSPTDRRNRGRSRSRNNADYRPRRSRSPRDRRNRSRSRSKSNADGRPRRSRSIDKNEMYWNLVFHDGHVPPSANMYPGGFPPLIMPRMPLPMMRPWAGASSFASPNRMPFCRFPWLPPGYPVRPNVPIIRCPPKPKQNSCAVNEQSEQK